MPAIIITISQQSSKISSSLLSTEITELQQSSSLSSPTSLSWDCQVYATRRNLFVSAIVDLRSSKAVHCPNLNACLVNESRSGYDRVNCQTIHFGYAIPINIVPIQKNPELVGLVLDQSIKLNNQIVNFLLDHHPQLRQQQCFYDMAATAKHDLRRKFPADSSASGEEDIAAIAKQISDHAEAIYQTWKSRGLAPTEILTCHSNTTAVDKFGSTLTPCNSPTIGNAMTGNNIGDKMSSPSVEHSSSTTVDILNSPNLDNGNLEKLVNNFVVEDKARIAASKQKLPSKPLPSSIQFALQKFEKNSIQQQQMTVATKNNIIADNSKKLPSVLLSPTLSFLNKSSQIIKPQIPMKTSGSHHCEVFLETIETTFPVDLTSSNRMIQQKRPTSTLITSSSIDSSLNINSSHSTTSGLTTWPLKNKLNDVKKITDVSLTLAKTSQQEDITKIVPGQNEKKSVMTDLNSRCAYLDEVAREEERLINALKTGVVITEEPERTEITCLRNKKQKPAIKQEKPKIESVKQIIIGGHYKNNSIVSNSRTSSSMVNIINNDNVGTVATVPTSLALVNNAKSFSKDDLSAMSAVDYAKARYQAAQENPPTQQRLEEQRASNNTYNSCTTEQLVSSVKTKFEMEIQKDKDVKDLDKHSVTSRWGSKITSSRPRLEQAVPHPELTNQQKQHIRTAVTTGTGNNPIRPFLTRGSVAERVLIFEKCPSELLLDKRGPRQPAINTLSGHEVQNKAQIYSREKTQHKSLPPHTTLQRQVKANRSVHIPRFYFPGGKPLPLSQLEMIISKITATFQSLPNCRASQAQFHIITKACDLPLYWKIPLFLAAGGEQKGFVEMNVFLEFWKKLTTIHHDPANKFITIVTRGLRNNILPEDLIPLVQDVVETHPGLTFLKEATEFHSRYVHTVIARIFYCVNRSWSGKISIAELRRSNLLAMIAMLEHEEDINQVTAYFSYEHFYVIYCKFWELDRDHDLFIDKIDLTRHNDHALSTRMIERIFSGAVTRGSKVKNNNDAQQTEGKMSYTEFVWFLLSEEDKNHPTAIEYWFRCMDLDGDGYLSMYELEYFYEEQLRRMEAIGLDTLPFEDCLCQMLDMIHPVIPGKISLNDLKKCKMTSIFFDTFFNLEKYLDHEQRDPFASTRDHDPDGQEVCNYWDRFAAEEYELLVAEESGNEQQEQTLHTIVSWKLSPNVDILIDNSVDMVKDSNSLMNSLDIHVQQSRHDSGDTDYADSDN
ncbi:Serine/threonine-protein phosphatase 2A regulatory subunit B'' subunit alpha [Acromyrmex echinatior]|uniref:Serine/threonine-protein phosphatase 2A regulatory subunit B'' subunit alpha n=1 Tax=Acromyrmex echinatior TaxID=103372 RepID=F4X3J9_ACREC|nr:Serine/threonine-protein phosphatase 2A regulatory subunit B'' subunit alpha [Acromyrmex echinatior]